MEKIPQNSLALRDMVYFFPLKLTFFSARFKTEIISPSQINELIEIMAGTIQRQKTQSGGRFFCLVLLVCLCVVVHRKGAGIHILY